MDILKLYLLSVAIQIAGGVGLHAQSITPADKSGATVDIAGAQEKRALDLYRRLPLRFEENRGQTSTQSKFLSREAGATLFLTSDGAVLNLSPNTRAAGLSGRRKPTVLWMKWMGANAASVIEGLDQLPGKSNYFIGNRADGWRTGISVYSKVRYNDLYPGVDLVYYGSGGDLEYDLVLSPLADPGAIRLSIRGASQVRVGPEGDLILMVGGREVRLHKPTIYQLPAGDTRSLHPPLRARRERIEGRYVRKGRHEIGFTIGDYDRTRPLVIDPQLTYSSYVGGSGSDNFQKVAVDASGNAYIVGYSTSADFPTLNPYQASSPGSTNAIVAKLNPELPGAASLEYSTYIGGSGLSAGRGIAVDASGQIYVAGDTNAPNFPVSPGAFQTACKMASGVCTRDAFATKLSASGSTLLYSTYIGGTGDDFGFGLAIDAAGHFFVTGPTGSPDFPVSPGAFQTIFAGGGNPNGDAFVTEINAGGLGNSDLIYSTYLGGAGSEQGSGIAVDSSGGIYVAGNTTSSNFPLTAGAYSSTYGGTGSLSLGDAFVTKLNPAGQGNKDLVYSTYLGGAGDDRGEGIAVDSAGKVYVTGFTGSSGFPVTTSTAFQSTFGGGTCNGSPCADAFLAKLDPAGSGAGSLLYSTFFGGSSFDLGHAIALDGAGLVYVSGETASLNFPLANPIQNTCAAGCTPLPIDDAFISQWNLTLPGAAGLMFSSYLGGNNVDTAWGIAVDAKGNAYTSGQVFSPDFPTLIPYQASCNNCSSFIGSTPRGDGFLVKVCFTDCPAATLSASSVPFMSQNVGTTSPPQPVTYQNSGSGDLTFAGITVTGANPGDYAASNNCPVVLVAGAECTINVTFTPSAAGVRAATLTLNDNSGGSPKIVSLSGTGVGPAVALSAASLPFGNQNLNSTSLSQSFTVTDSGPGALAITSIGVTGANSGDFAQTNDCPVSPATLAVNANCTITVTFTPTSSGARSAAVTIIDNGTGSPQSVSLSGTGVSPASTPWPNGYTYQASFTAAAGKVPSTQSNFPALISGTFSDFKTIANGGKIANTCAQTVGTNSISVPCDLIFTSDAAGTALLGWEFESYNAATGAAIIWVNVPTLSSGTVVYAWYGNSAVSTLQTTPTATWSSSFLAVYHLKELPNGAAPQMNDSTGNANHGTTNGAMPASQQVAGEIGGSLSFSGGNYYVTLANAANFSFERTDSFSVSCWVKPTNGGGILFSKEISSAPVAGWLLQQFAGTSNPTFGFDLANNGNASRAQAKTTAEFSSGAWHHVTATYAGTSTVAGLRIYVDGVSQALTTLTNNLTGSILTSVTPEINGRNGGNALTATSLDECRVSAKGVVLPADWVTSTYNNQSSPASFFTVATGLTAP